MCVFQSSCDADPSALAKYVVALVKKDKSEKELKALCIDQLDVFLQKGNQAACVMFVWAKFKLFVVNGFVSLIHLRSSFNPHHHLLAETQLFVDKLFEAINNKSYLPQTEQPSSLVKVQKDEPKKEEVMHSL